MITKTPEAKKVEQKIKDLVRLQAYYFSQGNLKRCDLIANRIHDLMMERDQIFEDMPTCTNWYYKDSEAVESFEEA